MTEPEMKNVFGGSGEDESGGKCPQKDKPCFVSFSFKDNVNIPSGATLPDSVAGTCQTVEGKWVGSSGVEESGVLGCDCVTATAPKFDSNIIKASHNCK